MQRDSVAGRAYLDVKNLARRTRRPTAELLHAYALEGFLDRLARSPEAGLGLLATSLAGFPGLAQSRWVAWRRRQLLDGLLPEDFGVLLDAVTAFADPCLHADAAPGVWDSTARRWRPVGEPRDGR